MSGADNGGSWCVLASGESVDDDADLRDILQLADIIRANPIYDDNVSVFDSELVSFLDAPSPTAAAAASGDDSFLCSVCSLAVLDPTAGPPSTYFLHLSLSSVILINSSTESPVHVLMLSIQAFLACVPPALFVALSLSPGNSLVSLWCDHSMLAI